MGTIRQGANGGFSGKAGSVIGSSWNNVSYIKGLPKLSNKPASLKQLDQRARFAAVLAYLGPIKDVLMIGWKGQAANRVTGFNMGVQQALGFALTGSYPDYGVDKSLILVSKGSLQFFKSDNITSPEAGKIQFSWTPYLNELNADAKDALVVTLYNEEQKQFLLFTKVAFREDGNVILDIPQDYHGQALHAYMFYVNEAGTRQSNSTYIGPINI